MKRSTSRELSLGAKGFRLFVGAALIHFALLSCTGGHPPPSNGGNTGGPQAVINSPADGSRIAGTVYFSVQPLDPSTVQSVKFMAGGNDLGTDTTLGDGFKVFLNAKDHPGGNLELHATITGKNGKVTTKTIHVENVPNPPSTATVDSRGAVLGTLETNGSTSVLTVLPGTAQGASVTFESRTQEEVNAETGVDYDALGVTFLGAQEIGSSQPIDQALMVSSGGFGPMVQPGQVVVNYMIAPDADGDGIGELVVVNTASVAPTGDVISDPVPRVQVGVAETTSSSGTTAIGSLQSAAISGSPGTIVAIEGRGFNPGSLYGNLAIFQSMSSSETVTFPGHITLDSEDSTGQVFNIAIPPLPAGTAQMTIVNTGSGSQFGPIDVTITSPSQPAVPASEVIDAFLAQAIAFMGSLPATEPDAARYRDEGIFQAQLARRALQDVYVQLESEPNQDLEAALEDAAIVIHNSGILGRLVPSGLGALAISDQEDQALKDLETIGKIVAAIVIIATATTVSGPLLTAAAAFAAALLLWSAYHDIEKRLRPGCPSLISTAVTSIVGAITGMGSTQAPGGCGISIPIPLPSVLVSLGSLKGSTGTIRGELGSAQVVPSTSSVTASAFDSEFGRVHVKVFSGGSALPFTALSDADGYVFIPLIPEGEPFTALATDTETGETRTFEGMGPAVGESVYMFFNFLGEGGSGAVELQFGTTTLGSIESSDEVDFYSFDADAGDQVFLKFTTTSGNFTPEFDVFGPNGAQVCGDFSFSSEVLEECAIGVSGPHTLSLTSSASGVSGDYEIYIQRISDPANATPIAFNDTFAGTVDPTGEMDTYTFDGAAGDTILLRMTSISGNLTVTFRVYGPDGALICNDFTFGGYVDETCMLDSGGRHTILAGSSAPGTTGDYNLFLQRLGDPVGATTIAFGQTLAGTIDPGGEMQTFVFDGASGEQGYLKVTVTSGDLNPIFQVYRPDATLVCSNFSFSGSVEETCALDASGAYTVVVGSSAAGTIGDYQLFLQRTNGPVGSRLIAYGGSLAGTVDPTGEMDAYTFSGVAGDQALVEVMVTSGNLNASVRVFRPDGTLLCSDFSFSSTVEGLCALDSSGTHAILVGSFTAGTTGGYDLNLTLETP